MVVTLAGQVLALVGVVILAALLRRFTRLELSLACVLCGFLAGVAVGFIGFDTGIRAHNLRDLVFFVILPVLVFEAAWHIRPALLRRWLVPVLFLATAGVLISCLVTAALVYLGIGHPRGFPWVAALLTGAILAATDPVAGFNLLGTRNASGDLATLFEGESLFNDASAIVLFSLILALALDGGETAGTGLLGHFALVFAGGAVVGLVVGLVGTALILLLGRSASTTFVLLFTAFGAFYLADHVLHVSGIMAVMTAALVAHGFLSEVEDSVAGGLHHTWEWLGELFNSLLFVIMGLVVTAGMFASHWLAMMIAIVAALVARASAVGFCGFLSNRLSRPISRNWRILLTWGGLRGAIALALALSLPVELEYWYTVQSMVFGVVLFGLLVQGTTIERLVGKLQ